MVWNDLEKMTVLKLREEALRFPQIESVHGKSKGQLMEELANALGIEKPHVHFSEAPCGSDAQRPANFSRNAASASSVARVPLFSTASDE